MPSNLSNFLELFELISKAELKFPNHRKISNELKDFILKLLEKDPMKRITAAEIKLHPFILGEKLKTINSTEKINSMLKGLKLDNK